MANYPQLDDCSGIWTLKEVNDAVMGGYWREAGTKALVGGGDGINVIDQFTIATTGDATDFGDLSVARYQLASCGSFTRAIWAGGYVSAGLGIFDTMNYIKPNVATICMGAASSMAAVLLAGGTNGKRSALPNSRVMIHQPLGGAEGQASDIKIQADEILRLRQSLNSILAKSTKQTIKKIEKDTDRNFFMSAEEAKEYGIIDTILKARKK